MKLSASWSSAHPAMLQRLEQFFDESTTKAVLLPLLDSNPPISLRALDWLCTNESKKHNIVCRTPSGTLFNIHNGYKCALSIYRRNLFDPFRRRNRHNVVVDGKTYQTTVAQLNFVQWACESGVLTYAIRNAKRLDSHMNMFANQHKAMLRRQHQQGVRHKRGTLNKLHSTKCHVYREEHIVRLDMTYEGNSPNDSGRSVQPPFTATQREEQGASEEASDGERKEAREPDGEVEQALR